MEWWERAADLRRSRGLSQAALAKLVPISVSSLGKYETGVRHPSRLSLVRMLDVLKAPRDVRDEILVAAGYPADSSLLGPSNADYFFEREEALRDLEGRPWPAALVDEVMQVLGANRLLQRVWDVSLDARHPDPVARNLMSVVSHPRIATKLVNWREAVKVGIATMKGHRRGAEDLSSLSPYFASVIDRFVEGVPHRVGELQELWDRTPARAPKIRWSFPVTWQLDGLPRMRFEVVVNTANHAKRLAFLDWIPVDAVTWEAIESLRRDARGARA